MHIIFYQLTDNGWDRGNHFIEDASLTRDTYGNRFVRVAFNGRSAFIGFPYADVGGTNSGAVFIYERNSFGVWEKRDEPLAPQDEDSGNVQLFGYSVDLDGDLACVISDGAENIQHSKVYVFQNDGDKWVQIRR